MVRERALEGELLADDRLVQQIVVGRSMIVRLRSGEPERDVDALEGADGLGEDELEKRADHVHGRAAGQEPDERLDVTPPVAAERIVQWLLYPPLQTREVLARDRTAVARHDVLLGQSTQTAQQRT